jgi:hypothetical protein
MEELLDIMKDLIQDDWSQGQIEMKNLLYTKHAPTFPVPKLDHAYITVQTCVLAYFKH